MQYTKIVKLASGNVQLQNASDSPVKTLQPAANLELLPDDAGVRIKQWQGENTDILISQVAFTRLDPAADVAFAGTAQDLMTLLSASFFFELVASAFQDYPVGTRQSFLESGYMVVTNQAAPINTLQGYFIKIEENTDIDSLRVRISGGVAGNSIYGVYDVVDGYPTSLVFSGAEISNTTGGVNVDAVINQTINAGFYFVAYSSSSAATFFAYTSAILYSSMFGTLASVGVQTGYTIARTYDSTLPATFPIGATFTTAQMTALTFLIQ
jgi:hypothetical protein